MEDQNEKKERKRSTSREKRARLKEARKMGLPLFTLADPKGSKKKIKRQSSVRSGYQLPSIYTVPKGGRGRNEKPRPLKAEQEHHEEANGGTREGLATTPNSFDGTPQPPMLPSTMRSPTDPSVVAGSNFSDRLNPPSVRNITVEPNDFENGLNALNAAEESPSVLRSVSVDDHSVSVSGNTYTSRVSKVSIHTADSVLSSNDPLVTASNIVMGRHEYDLENISNPVSSGVYGFQDDESSDGSSLNVRRSAPQKQKTTLQILDKLHEKDTTFKDSRSKLTVPTTADEEQESSPQMAFVKQDQFEEKEQFSKKKRWIIALLVLLVVIGVIVGVVVAAAGKGDNAVAQILDTNPKDVRPPSDTSNETISPAAVGLPTTASPQGAAPATNAPASTTSSPVATTSSPALGTSSPTSVLESFASFLAANITRGSPQSEAALNDMSSPQYRALLWLAEQQISQPENVEDFVVLQRFALVTFYYATNGQEWSDSGGWLDYSLTECRWTNVRCATDQKVVTLRLEGNNLSGTLPDELALLTNLSFFAVKDSKGLVGPLPYGFFAADSLALKNLAIVGCAITGTIPAILGNIGTLETVQLSDNALTGTLPTELGQAVRLNLLEVHGNRLWGAIPNDLVMLTNLTELNLGDNSFTGSIPLGLSSSLKIFVVKNNNLTGGLQFMDGLSSLMNFSGSNNLLNGPWPETLGDLVSLTSLVLEVNQISGTVPTALASLPYIETLNLAGNYLSGTIPGETLWTIQTTIKYLSLGSNLLSGTIPTLLGSLTALTFLDFSENQLISSFPTEIGAMSLLTELRFEANELTGRIPSEFGLLFNMGEYGRMDISNNRLNGTIPVELGNMRGILELILDHNKMSGTLPGELGNLPELNVLRVASNKLWGPLPSDLSAATKLDVLYIGYNGFTGTIPEAYAYLIELSDLRTEGNELIGPIQELICVYTQLQNVETKHFSVECPMECQCCDECVSTQ